MKTTPFSVAVALTVAIGFVGLPGAKRADNPRMGAAKAVSGNGGSDRWGGEGSSPSQKAQVAQMLAGGPQRVEFAVTTFDDRQQLMRDPVERVRFRAAHALELLTGKIGNFINLDGAVWGRPPLMTVRRARDSTEAQQAGTFLRTAFFERQGDFSYRGGIPAQFQTEQGTSSMD